MQINISRKSWHTQLFKWYFGSYSLPQSLCPYFWGLVLIFATVIPITVVAIPAYLLWVAYNLYSREDKWPYPVPALMSLAGLGLIILGVWLWATVLAFVHWFTHRKLTEADIAIIGLLGVIAAGFLGAGIIRIVKGYQKRNSLKSYAAWCAKYERYGDYSMDGWYKWRAEHTRTSIWVILGEGIRTLYTKACPIINWQK